MSCLRLSLTLNAESLVTPGLHHRSTTHPNQLTAPSYRPLVCPRRLVICRFLHHTHITAAHIMVGQCTIPCRKALSIPLYPLIILFKVFSSTTTCTHFIQPRLPCQVLKAITHLSSQRIRSLLVRHEEVSIWPLEQCPTPLLKTRTLLPMYQTSRLRLCLLLLWILARYSMRTGNHPRTFPRLNLTAVCFMPPSTPE
ncbi:hypothetical protein EDB85DRAFT_1936820, partial [Lactarius pseudohatsudake]